MVKNILRKKMKHIIKNSDNINNLKNNYPHLEENLPEASIVNYLEYRGKIGEKKEVILTEKKNENFKVTIEVEMPNKIKEIIQKIETIKKNPNKYAKEGLLNPKKCTIEKLRKDILIAKKIIGPMWEVNIKYEIDAYKGLKDLLISQKATKVHLENWILKNDYLLCDNVGPHLKEKKIIRLGKRLAWVAFMLWTESKQKEDLDLLVSFILNVLGEKYELVEWDAKHFDLLPISIENIDIKKGSFVIRNLTCCSIGKGMEKGSVILDGCDIEFMLHNARALDKVELINCKTFSQPLENGKEIGKIIIKGMKNYDYEKIREASRKQEPSWDTETIYTIGRDDIEVVYKNV